MGREAVEEPGAPAGLEPRRRGTWSRRRTRAAAAGALALAAAVVAVAVLGSGSPGHANGTGGIPPGQTTTTVERRTLTESTTVDGTLGYRGSTEIYDRLAAAGTFTWLPTVGTVVGRGGTLYRVNNKPVVLMYGSVPAYRTLKAGVSDGPDVRELNANLAALGYASYSSIGTSEHFGEATREAVERWQKADGLTQSGEVELGRVVFASDAQRITKLHVTLGQDPPGNAAAEAAAAAEEKPPAQQPSEKPASEKPSAADESPAKKSPASKSPSKKSPAKESPAKKSPSKKSPSSEPSAKESSAREPSANKDPNGSKNPSSSNEGGGGGAGTLVVSTTSTRQVVQLQVKANQQQLAHVGEATPVTLPDGRIVHGHISSVGTVATESSEGEGSGNNKGNGGGGNGESATVSVTIALDHRVARLDKAPVSVELVKAVRRNVLAVAATALTATGGGGYAVQAVQDGRRVEIPVTPGMFANGYVEIEGTGVHEGLTVLVSR
jgi:peptidoglycan hydrolase-like protein with peptidoglycan-binding domain